MSVKVLPIARAVILVSCLAVASLSGSSCGKANESNSAPSAPSNSNSAARQSNENNNGVAGSDNANRPGEMGDVSSQEFEGTAGTVEKKNRVSGPALLRDVRTASHEKFDRVVFEFAGDALPGYHVEYVDRPVRQCGSGNVVPIAGDAWLVVRLDPAQAHTEGGQPAIKDRERSVGLPLLRELKLICDFEADVSWVLGLSRPNRYRVLELSNPPRIVIDVKR